MMESKLRLGLLKRSNEIFEKTKYDFKNYTKERRALLEFTQKENPNYLLWKHMVKDFETLIEFDKKVNLQKQDIGYLKELSTMLKNQKTREQFSVDTICIFEIVDKFNNHMHFFTRKSAENFIKIYNKDFNNNTEIKVIENVNKDLEFLLHLIERNF